MTPPPGNESNDKRMMVMWLLWAAMTGALGIYVLIAHLLDRELFAIGREFPLDLVRYILLGVSAAVLIATRFIRRIILSKPSGQDAAAPLESSPAQIAPAIYAKYTTAMIVALALSESIGIYGLVLFFLGDGFKTLYTFTGISAVAMFYYRPQREEIEALARKSMAEKPSAS